MTKKDVQYWLNEASKYIEDGNIWLALNAYNSALKIESDNPDLLVARCALLLEVGSIDRALEAAEKVLKIDPTNVDSRYYKGLILYRGGDVEKAFRVLDEANKLDPTDVRVLILMGVLSGKMGMIEEGKEFCSIAKQINPDYTDRLLHGLLGMVEGDAEKSRSNFEAAGRILSKKYREKEEFR